MRKGIMQIGSAGDNPQGFAITIRLANYKKLWVHVDRAALHQLDNTEASLLTVLSRHMVVIQAIATSKYDKTGDLILQIDLDDVLAFQKKCRSLYQRFGRALEKRRELITDP